MYTNKSGWVKKRRSLLLHILEAKITAMEYLVEDLLIMTADSSTGCCCTSAPALVALTSNSLEHRTVQNALKGLEEKGYIRRVITQGKKGNYRILVDKYLCTTGPNVNKRLILELTTNPMEPVYLLEGDDEDDEDKTPSATSTRTVLPEPVASGPTTPEELKLIEDCYRVAEKELPTNVTKMTVLLRSAATLHTMPHIQELLTYCESHPWWKERLKGSRMPVNMFLKSLDTLSEQSDDARQRQESSSPARNGRRGVVSTKILAEIAPLVSEAYEAWKPSCPSCHGTGETEYPDAPGVRFPCDTCNKKRAMLSHQFKSEAKML